MAKFPPLLAFIFATLFSFISWADTPVLLCGGINVPKGLHYFNVRVCMNDVDKFLYLRIESKENGKTKIPMNNRRPDSNGYVDYDADNFLVQILWQYEDEGVPRSSGSTLSYEMESASCFNGGEGLDPQLCE